MAVERITSRKNPLIVRLRSLANDGAFRRAEGEYLCDGHKLLTEALEKGADVLITGDISHHDGLDAVEKGIAVIDATHYGIEKLFVPYMEKYLTGEFPELKILRAHEKEPFTLV